MGKLLAVPSLPPHLLPRPDRLRALKDAVMADLSRPVVVTGVAARAALQGMGGIGKSVLAAAFVHDHRVRQAFPDGILWVPLGQEPDLAQRQRETARALGDTALFETVQEGNGQRLRELLEDRAVLLVLDDLWDARDADAFDVLGPRCRMVLTTRDASIVTALGATEHQVQLLTRAEAHHLVAEWAGLEEAALPDQAEAKWRRRSRRSRACRTSSAGSTITLSAKARRDASGEIVGVVLGFADDGAGIHPQDLEIILAPRKHPSQYRVKRRNHGSEIGLGFCRVVAEAHGGRIWARSELGHGAAFCVELPVA